MHCNVHEATLKHDLTCAICVSDSAEKRLGVFLPKLADLSTDDSRTIRHLVEKCITFRPLTADKEARVELMLAEQSG